MTIPSNLLSGALEGIVVIAANTTTKGTQIMAVFELGHYTRAGEAFARRAGLELATTDMDWTAMTTSMGKVTVTLKTLLVLDEAEYNDIFNNAKESNEN